MIFRISKLFIIPLLCFIGADAAAQVRIGHMRGLSSKKKKHILIEAPVTKRTAESVQQQVQPGILQESRKEMDAMFYVQWNDSRNLDFADFKFNKNLYNKFFSARDTDITRVIYPDYRIFYKKLSEKMNAFSDQDDTSWRAKAEKLLASGADTSLSYEMPVEPTDSAYSFSISIDSPAASVINIAPVIYAVNENTWYYNISALFSTHDSWMIVRSKDILEHEQIHFDIFELYARRMRKLFLETLKQHFADNAASDISTDILPQMELLYQQLNDKQLDFDRETMALTAANASLQQINTAWRRQLRKEIDLLGAYAIAEGYVTMK